MSGAAMMSRAKNWTGSVAGTRVATYTAGLHRGARNFTTSAVTQAEGSKTAVYAGLILSRIPIVTKDLTPFEEKFYHYQAELKKRLMWTFPQYYYFRKGTLSERRFLDANRGPVSYQPGVYFPKGNPDLKHNRERTQKQVLVVPREESSGTQVGEDSVTRPVKPISRLTDADTGNDLKSLERQLSRTLYLLVKQQGAWKFPSFEMADESSLSEAVDANLQSSNANQLKDWLVSETPTAVLKYGEDSRLVNDPAAENSVARKEYLLKSHIIAGSFAPADSKLIQDFQWCTKEEIADLVDGVYYDRVSCLLSDV